MAAIHRLTHLKASKIKKPGVYEDGGGLRLVVGPGETKRWVVRVTIQGQRRERGLGRFSVISLDEARAAAAEFRTHAKQGRDLAFERKIAEAKSTTFNQAFKALYEIKSKTLTNAKHAKQWQSTMETYVFPKIGARPVAEISAGEVLQVLSPIWFDKPETARRVLQRMEAVFKSAILRGSRTLASPCIGVVQELGTRHRTVEHHASLPWVEIPRFLADLNARKSLPSTRLALEFLILTAARSGEVRGAAWTEIALAEKEWRIPLARMKGRSPHTVPLSGRAIDILRQIREEHPASDLLFPAASGAQLSDMTFTKLIRDMNYGGRATGHGFRSSFKVWAAEVAKVRDEVSEACLAHKIPEKVRAAYLRTDFLEERRSVMQLWACALGHVKAAHGCE
ncbi:MAG: tyrosine-type recombinase/integrase [Hyphomicrobium sp.]